MANGIYYVDDYSGSAYKKICDAINAAHTAGGGEVVLGNSTYAVSQSIQLHSNITFRGVGASSIITCSVDTPILRIDRNFENILDSNDIIISNMTLTFSSMQSSTRFHIEADRPLNLKIVGVTINGTGRIKSGILTWDASSGSQTSAIQSSENFSAFMTHIENCLLNCASIWLNDSDSRILNNYIWANKPGGGNQDYAIRLNNGSVNVSGNDIVSGNVAGVYMTENASLVRIENNYFDGSWESVYTGWGVYMDHSTRSIITGNTFANIYKGGINVIVAHQISITSNVFCNCNRSGLSASRYDVFLQGDSSHLSTGHIIANNQHMRSIVTGAHYAVRINNYAQANVVNNVEIDWAERGTGYTKPVFYFSSNKYSVNRLNRVTSKNTSTYPILFDEGQVSIGSTTEAASVHVSFSSDFSTHNITPKLQDISVNFVGSLSNSRIVFSIYNLSSSGFDIAYKRCDSSSATQGIFFWRVNFQ